MFDPAPTRDYATDDQKWQAVETRDRGADGAFLICVKTTGVYCRPHCPARTPKRQNVLFVATPHAAQALGFRACKRCKPDQKTDREAERAAVLAAARAIEQAIVDGDRAPGLDRLAEGAGYSRFHFHRLFKSVLGVTPAAYGAAVRAGRLAQDLPSAKTVTEALYDAGYASASRFYETSGRLGMAPKAALRGGDGEAIRFATADCALGQVLVAATAKGVCAIQLGNDRASLIAALGARFPKAELTPGGGDFQQVVDRVVALVADPRQPADLPLDIRGTAFQERVWQALRAIPAGETRTYGEIAAAIGAPKAIRGVASACAANPVAVAVPCHRVVRKGGDLAGYRWGLARKRALLKTEGAL